MQNDLGVVHKLYIKRVIPVRADENRKMIICAEDSNIHQISKALWADVKTSARILKPKQNEVYGLRFQGKRTWYRAMLKFWRGTTAVVHLLDKLGVYDLNSSIEIRLVKNEDLRTKLGEIKMFMFGFDSPNQDNHEFDLIFDQKIRNKPTIAIFVKLKRKKTV